MERPTGCTWLVSVSWSPTVSLINTITVLLNIIHIMTAINTWAKFYKKCAERDGKIDCGEKVGMAVNKMSSGVMTLVDFVMLIWGSVVVFGAWSTWTYDYNEYKEDMDEKNYCMYQPMMTAFVLLLIKWVSYSTIWIKWG